MTKLQDAEKANESLYAENLQLKSDLDFYKMEAAKYRCLYEEEHYTLNGALLAMEVAVSRSAPRKRFKAA